MRCYRCGACMEESARICPACGFDLCSPVEIRAQKGMKCMEIYDDAGNLLWSGSDTETAYIDAPDRKRIRICWRFGIEAARDIRNGEAYRFEQIPGFAHGFVRLVKTRRIPKRKHGKKRSGDTEMIGGEA